MIHITSVNCATCISYSVTEQWVTHFQLTLLYSYFFIYCLLSVYMFVYFISYLFFCLFSNVFLFACDFVLVIRFVSFCEAECVRVSSSDRDVETLNVPTSRSDGTAVDE